VGNVIRNTLKSSKPLLGGILSPLDEIPYTSENISMMKLYCSRVRNFKNTSLRKVISRLGYLNFQFVENFKRFWLILKVVQDLEPTTRGLCYELLRNGYSLEYHLMYQETVDWLAESERFMFGFFNEFRREQFSELKFNLIQLLIKVDPELWIPISAFPRFHYEKEGKMKYAFVEFKGSKTTEFRELVISFIDSLPIKELFVPPPDLCLKVSSSRRNDGGVVLRDYERSRIPTKPGSFLYQKFNPKPLETREVWLPDRTTKINNAFWMLIARQILKSCDIYPDPDPTVTWGLIKDKLWQFGLFDMSGFGFQYPREYLEIIAEEICHYFYCNEIYDNLLDLRTIFKNVNVQMEDGTFQYPPRGIGLGYYEDLKTLGIMAVLAKFHPISLYGDQGLLNDYTLEDSVARLRDFEFIINDDKYQYKRNTVKWSGWTMTTMYCKRPKQVLSPLVAFLSAQYHWERKLILRSFSEMFPQTYKEYSKRLPFLYELIFGYEFHKTDSLLHFKNGGVSTIAPVVTGFYKSVMAERLVSPADNIVDSIIYTTPFFTEWKRSDAKAFSIKRKATYKKTHQHTNGFVFEYCNPYIEENNNRKPQLPRLAGVLTDAQETKLIVNHNLTSGKFTHGLNSDQMLKALQMNSLSKFPFKSFATGGYRVITKWRGVPMVPSDQVFLWEHFSTKVDLMRNFMVSKFHVLHPPGREYNKMMLPKRKIVNTDIHEDTDNVLLVDKSNKRSKFNTLTLDMVNNIDNLQQDGILNAGSLDIRMDMSSHFIEVGDYTGVSYDSADDELFLDEDELSKEG